MSALLTAAPNEQDSLLARESSRQLLPHLDQTHDLRLQIVEGDQMREVVEIPAAALRLLIGILDEMAEGNAVSLTPAHVELTTQQAADFLNVSRPFLIGLLETGQIPFHKAGSHRRVLFQDVAAHKSRMVEKRQEALKELAALSQEMGMGY